MLKKISFVVPIYNNEDWLPQCIESLCRQGGGEIEIILVDDGSTDRSLDICRSYEEKDSRIRVFSQQNSGANVARNRGLEAASGEWIYFADGDDWIEGNVLDSLADYMDGSCDMILFSNYIAKNNMLEEADHADCVLWFGEKDAVALQAVTLNRLGAYPYNAKVLDAVSIWNKLYRRSFLEEHYLRFLPELAKLQDLTFNLMVYDYIREAVFVNVPIYAYRINETSVTHRYQPDLPEKFSAIHTFLLPFVEKKEDAMLTKAMWERIATHSRTLVVLDFCHAKNSGSYRQRRADFRNLMRSEPYCSMKRNVDVRNFTFQEVLLSAAVNHNFFWLCELLCKANALREGIKK